MGNPIENYQELQDAVSVSVKINNAEKTKVIVNDLISKRKHCFETGRTESVNHFDFILKYYLGDEDFKKYINA